MIRDITIGQYYPSDSVLHRLDPRVKLFATMIYVISLFLDKSVIALGAAAIILGLVIAVSRVPLSYIVRGLKPVLFLLLFSCVLNMFFTRGETVWWEWKFLTLSKEGLFNAGFMGARLVLLVVGSSLMTFTTTPNQLTDGIEKAFRPLNKLHLPVHEFAMMMSIALRFIPILTEELDKIMKAQAARCAGFEEGNLIEKAKGLVPIMIPLFVSAIRRANDLALAMEARCYQGGTGRTKMYPLYYKKWDYVGYGVIFLYLAGMIALKILVLKYKLSV